MKQILILTDFSENSKNAMHYALKLFQDTTCHFNILYINTQGVDYKEKPIYNFGTNILVEREPFDIDEKLKNIEQYLLSISGKSKNHRFTTVHEEGYFLQSIQKYIQNKKVELIVMGTHGASELKEFFIGTRSGDVITNVECDVLVIPEHGKYKGFKEVVIPLDFNLGYSEGTLKTITNMITSEKTRLRLLYVTESRIPPNQNIEIKQKEMVRRLSEKVPNPVTFQRIIARKTEDGVQKFAESIDADLIIMISKDYGFLQKLFLDTTVEEVSFDTKIPLLSLQG